MARSARYPRTGGRKKGTPNRRSLDLAEQLRFIGLDVPAEIDKVLPELNAVERSNTLLEQMAFLFPKRKAVEHSGEILNTSGKVDTTEATPEKYNARNKKMMKITRLLLQTDPDCAMNAI